MIERLYVNNFRCFENFTLDLKDRPSALVIGKNGTGKSALRHALALFQRICRGASRAKELLDARDCAQHRRQIPLRMEIELTLGERHFQYAIAFEIPDSVREARVVEERLEVAGKAVYSREQSEVKLAGGSTFGLDSHIIALPVIKESTAERSLEQLRSFFASMILIAPAPANMTGFSEEESGELQHDAANVSAWLNALLSRYPAAYNSVLSYLTPAIPDFAAFENVSRGERGKQLLVRFDQPETKQSLRLEFQQLSDGEKCFFLSALIAAANEVNPGVFCMWDEPDLHLSLPEVGHFITQLRKMTNAGGQFIATSHHPETIRRFSDETTLVLTRKSHLEPTVVRTLADFPYHGDLIEALVRDEVSG